MCNIAGENIEELYLSHSRLITDSGISSFCQVSINISGLTLPLAFVADFGISSFCQVSINI